MDYYSKYLKYKHKYTELKKLIGGNNSTKEEIKKEIEEIENKIKQINDKILMYKQTLKEKKLPNRENTETLLLGQNVLLNVEKRKLEKLEKLKKLK